MAKISIIIIGWLWCVLFCCHNNVVMSQYADTDCEEQSILIIPFKNSNEPFEKVDSFSIDGNTLMNIMSTDITLDSILTSLADVPELQTVLNALDEISIGDVYKTVFPKGLGDLLRDVQKRLNAILIKSGNKLPQGAPQADDSLDTDSDQLAADIYDPIYENNNSTNDANATTSTIKPTLSTTPRAQIESTTKRNKRKPEMYDASAKLKEWLQKLIIG